MGTTADEARAFPEQTELRAPDGCVTWSIHADRATKSRARAIAEACGLVACERKEVGGRTAIVVEKQGAYALHEGEPFRSHPGMGLLRVRRLIAGERFEQLLNVADVRPGDRVLDATFGFGQDALVLAWAVGAQGRVTALESSPLLAALAYAGLPHWASPGGELAERIDLRWSEHGEFLSRAPDRSFDVVVFDPMFRRPKAAAPGFSFLRAVANERPLTQDVLMHARRVARRLVVVKDAVPGRELDRLGLRKDTVRLSQTATFLFGTLPALTAPD